MRVLLLLLLLGCSEERSLPGFVFYCKADGACSLFCHEAPCTTQATATCAWLIDRSSFLCYADPADCAEAQKIIRLGECARRTPGEMIPR